MAHSNSNYENVLFWGLLKITEIDTEISQLSNQIIGIVNDFLIIDTAFEQ